MVFITDSLSEIALEEVIWPLQSSTIQRFTYNDDCVIYRYTEDCIFQVIQPGFWSLVSSSKLGKQLNSFAHKFHCDNLSSTEGFIHIAAPFTPHAIQLKHSVDIYIDCIHANPDSCHLCVAICA